MSVIISLETKMFSQFFFKNTSDGEESEDWPFRGMSVASTLDNRDDLLTLANFRTIFYKKRI